MTVQQQTTVPDVTKSVTVTASAAAAFAAFTRRPLDWWPESHVFVPDRVALVLEPFEGGRYYEIDADGTEVDWGRVVEWNPNRRIVLTWRVGPGWQPVHDDERASLIEVDFLPADDNGITTTIRLTHSHLERHGEAAGFIHQALDGPSPGETLANVAAVVEGDAPAQGVTLVNRFEVTGSVEEFEKAFHATSAYFADRPGFIDHRLLRSTQREGHYVNVARWRDERSLRAAVSRPDFAAHAQALRALATSEPEVFTSRYHRSAAV